MRILWICGLPDIVRREGSDRVLSPTPTAAWSWVLGHLPPEKDCELHILCPVGGLYAPRVDFEFQGAYWHCFRRHRFEMPLFWIRFYFQIRKFVKEVHPDVVHGWGGETGCGWLATLFTKHAIVSVQGLLRLFKTLLDDAGCRSQWSFSSMIRMLIEKLTYRRAAACLVESEASRQGLMEYYGQDSTLVHHPLRKEFIEFDLNRRVTLPEKPVKIVFVGTLSERKGALDALNAFLRVAEKDSEFVMIGEGPLRGKLESSIIENGLVGRVRLLGAINVVDVVSEFTDAQFFLLPSYGDTGPTALKEALSCGLYPICYDNSGPRDLISHYGCGRLCLTGDIDCLANELNKCITDMKECVSEGVAVANRVRSELSSATVWNELRAIYKKVAR